MAHLFYLLSMPDPDSLVWRAEVKKAIEALRMQLNTFYLPPSKSDDNSA